MRGGAQNSVLGRRGASTSASRYGGGGVLLVAVVVVAASISGVRGDDAVGADAWTRTLRPLFERKCWSCHGALRREADLRVDTVAALRKSGVVEPGEPAESWLLEKVRSADPDERMPPEGEGEPLTAEEVAVLEAWIRAGAPAPVDDRPQADPRAHWAFQAPLRPELPSLAGGGHPVDALLEARRREQGVEAVPLARPELLARRLWIDLVGLPPTPAEVARLVDDPTEESWGRLVDELLASPRHGERWGRHLMDIWRYSDWWGLGADIRNSRPHIRHWRDWIIESVNEDKPYDRMVLEMLAADELAPEDTDALRATGFLARSYFKFNRTSWLDDVLEHTSKAFLGLTMNCAKCHDHKYDPFTQRDYYELRAVFEPYQVRHDPLPGEPDLDRDSIPRAYDCDLEVPTWVHERGDEKRPRTEEPLAPGVPGILGAVPFVVEAVSLPAEAFAPVTREHVLEDRIAAARSTLATFEGRLASAQAGGDARAIEVGRREVAWARALEPEARAKLAAQRAEEQGTTGASLEALKREAAAAERRRKLLEADVAVARAERDVASAAAEQRAEAERRLAAARKSSETAQGEAGAETTVFEPIRVARKAPASVVETEEARRRPWPRTSTGRRLAFARWLVDPRNPLTARVMVNHVWARHMGRPLVSSVFDFGVRCPEPDHRELLDWLAVELVESGWSLRHLHRLIVTSRAYRLASSSVAATERTRERDPANRWLWRREPLRMEAQVVRDALLALSGELDVTMGGPPIDPVKDAGSPRRALWFRHSHNERHHFLVAFDDADVLECYRREESIVPQQALALSNSSFAIERAARVGAAIAAQVEDDGALIERAFVIVLGAPPSDAERALVRESFDELRASGGEASIERRAAWLVRALLNHNDFVTVR